MNYCIYAFSFRFTFAFYQFYIRRFGQRKMIGRMIFFLGSHSKHILINNSVVWFFYCFQGIYQDREKKHFILEDVRIMLWTCVNFNWKDTILLIVRCVCVLQMVFINWQHLQHFCFEYVTKGRHTYRGEQKQYLSWRCSGMLLLLYLFT